MSVEASKTAGGPPRTRDRKPPTVRTRRVFYALATVFVLFLAASSAPSPLYAIYQQHWHFSAWVLTVVFALYVVGLLAALLVVGGLSDHVGRRPVLAAAVGLEVLALVTFLAAEDVGVLALARVLQGIATGAATTTLSAALVDLEPARGRAGMFTAVAPLAGLAAGAVGSGLLVELAPAPTRLVYAVLLVGMLASAVVVAGMRETSGRRPGALGSLRPRVGLPAHLRPDILPVVPVMVSGWALAGMYLSLGPSVAADLLGLRSALLGGLVVGLLVGPGAMAVFLLRGRAATALLVPGALLLGGGTLTSLVGIRADAAWAAALGTILAGAGLGTSVLAAMGTVARVARPHERGEVFATANVISYLGNSVPAVLGGIAVTVLGLRTATEIYAVTIAVIALLALLLHVRRLRTERTTATPAPAGDQRPREIR
ncbi:MFS transporter [Promicromonospora citrea]|uniref:MFS transporter n=1 Tax=Promicromonospora citrea TaxID=43677 RepID=A0A8H9GGJ1_9MICO|nr:MFS transporter [Promicromonospora citrea]GGM22857.1 MFS transporter [Promicromonospora citrea]